MKTRVLPSRTLRGVTFVEMIVTIAIVSIVITGASVFFVRMWRLHGFTIETAVASMTAQRGVSEAVEHIRRARVSQGGEFPIDKAEAHNFSFYEDYDDDGVVERVRYFVEGSRFRVGVTDPRVVDGVSTYPDDDDDVRDAAYYVVNATAGMPTFTYYDANGKIFASADAETHVMPLPITDIGEIRMVKILLFVNPDAIRAPDHVRIQSFVVIRNNVTGI